MARDRFPTGGSLASVFAEIPEHIREFLGNGFKTLAKVKTESLEDLTHFTVTHFADDIPSDREVGVIGEKLGIEKDRVSELMSAASFVVQAISERTETSDEFIKEAKAIGLVGEAEEPSALLFAKTVAEQRQDIKRRMEAEDIAASVLPSLSSMQVAVDLRLSFKEGRVERGVPVAIMHVDTDTQREIWLQLSGTQVERMINDLNAILERIRAAEEIAKTIG